MIYYSRIFENGKYQSRLAACLVENETKSNTLIPENSTVKRGIAWWGKRDGLASHGATVPVDNESEIEKLLNVFHIPRYKGTETGTTVIIPYIDDKKLLNEVYAKNESKDDKPYWTNKLADYLNVAVQRWYAPRLLNKYYKFGPFLRVGINGKNISVSSMLSTFRIIRELYILAGGDSLEDESLIGNSGAEYFVESIDLRGVLNSTSSGKFAYGKFSRAQLKMDPPDNEKSPYQQVMNVNVAMEGGNGPIVMFTRQPAMIAGYDYDGQWTHRMPKSSPDEYIIGIFVVNSTNTLKNIYNQSNKPITLEEYIRQGEKADHALWMDRNIGGENPKIVASIQKNVINKIRKRYTEVTSTAVHRQNIGLGHALAELLLPDQDFGRIPTEPSKPSKPSKPSRRTDKNALRFTNAPVFLEDGNVRMSFSIQLNGKKCELFTQVITDFRKFTASQWEDADEIGKKFPVEIRELYIKNLTEETNKIKKHHNIDTILNQDSSVLSNDKIDIMLEKSKEFKTMSSAVIDPKNKKYRLIGDVIISFKDDSIKGGLDIKEIPNG